MYPAVQLLIDGAWGPSASGKTLNVVNPATLYWRVSANRLVALASK